MQINPNAALEKLSHERVNVTPGEFRDNARDKGQIYFSLNCDIAGLRPTMDTLLPTVVDLNEQEDIGLGLKEKDEVHITIIGGYLLRHIDEARKAEKLEPLSKSEDVVTQLRELCMGKEWKVKLTPHLYLITERNNDDKRSLKKRSIIQLIEIEGFDAFWEELCRLAGVEDLPKTVLHITLYGGVVDQNKKSGIGIEGVQHFEQLEPVGLNAASRKYLENLRPVTT